MSTDVTHDYEDARIFTVNSIYDLCYREPSSPNVPTGISLDRDGVHRGWLKNGFRHLVEPYMGKKHIAIKCQVEKLGKRWTSLDTRLEVNRNYREASAVCWLIEDEDGAQVHGEEENKKKERGD